MAAGQGSKTGRGLAVRAVLFQRVWQMRGKTSWIKKDGAQGVINALNSIKSWAKLSCNIRSHDVWRLRNTHHKKVISQRSLDPVARRTP